MYFQKSWNALRILFERFARSHLRYLFALVGRGLVFLWSLRPPIMQIHKYWSSTVVFYPIPLRLHKHKWNVESYRTQNILFPTWLNCCFGFPTAIHPFCFHDLLSKRTPSPLDLPQIPIYPLGFGALPRYFTVCNIDDTIESIVPWCIFLLRIKGCFDT